MHRSQRSLPQRTAIATMAYGDKGVNFKHLLQEAGDIHIMSASTTIFQLQAAINYLNCTSQAFLQFFKPTQTTKTTYYEL